MAGSDAALQAFLTESRENLQQLEQDLLALEKQPGDVELIASAFRAMHTIKGTCGFFGFSHLERLTHACEDALVNIREGHVGLTLDAVNTLLDAIDRVRAILSKIENDGVEPDTDNPELIARLQVISAGDGSPGSSAQAPSVDETTSGEPVANTAATAARETTIRVDVDLLDKLMNVVGELVLARNQLIQYAAGRDDGQLSSLSQKFNLVTSELQEGLMQTRMQPIGNAWESYPRLIRDLETQTGKRIRLDSEGGDTELDRSLLQAVRDPLVHLLRNAADHGIEDPAVRRDTGKPEQGTIKLRAYHESGNVIVEISDDGAGIDLEKVRRQALERNLLPQERLKRLSDQQVQMLIFEPGFSTAREVTRVSGRGVGLDVVKSSVERIGGTVDIQSQPGVGTSIKLRIPLTLAIIQALTVSCANERFAVPEVNLLEIVHVPAEEVDQRIERVHDAPVYRLRGRLLPLVELRQVLQLPSRPDQQGVFILVLQSDLDAYGLVVDEVRDTEEIVVKPLGKHLREADCFAGATIMGDGKIALIVDALAIAARARLIQDQHRKELLREDLGAADIANTVAENQAMLIIGTGPTGRAALPLGRVDRLEEFSIDAVEWSAGREVIQYRDTILPLSRLNELFRTGQQVTTESDNTESGKETLQVVVHRNAHGTFGLVVDNIIDIVEEELAGLDKNQAVPGVLGSAILNGLVTDLLDLDYIASRVRAHSGEDAAHG